MAGKWWNDDTYSHGIMVLPICGFLVWRLRDELAAMMPRPSSFGVLAMALCAILWLAGRVTDTMVIQQIAFVSMVISLVVSVLGLAVSRTLAFPLFYLYFMVPFGSELIPFLQDLTAEKTVWLLRLSGIPVYLDGIFLHIPDGSFEVARACAGIRFLVTSVTIGFLGAYLFYKSWWRRLAFISLSIIVPVVANFFRAYGIVMIAYWSDFSLAVGADHLTFGLIFLSIVIVALLALGALFRERTSLAPEQESSLAGVANPRAPASLFTSVCIAVVAVTVAVGAHSYGSHSVQRGAADGAPAQFPVQISPPWTALAETKTNWRPQFKGNDAEFIASYSNGQHKVEFYVAYYAYQRQGAEVVNENNAISDQYVWLRAGSTAADTAVDGVPMRVLSTRLVSGPRSRLVWSWYWVDGEFTANPYVAKLLQARSRLLGGMPAAAVIAVSADFDEKPSEVKPLLADFLANLEPLGNKLYLAARDGARTAKSGTGEPPPDDRNDNPDGSDSQVNLLETGGGLTAISGNISQP